MLLDFRNELSPDVEESTGPPVRALGHDVVRQDVVVADVGNDRNDVIVVRVAVVLVAIAFAKDLEHLVDHELVELSDLSRRAWVVLIVVVTRRVSCPDDKVDLISKLFSNPFYCLVDQRYRAVAIADLGAVDAGRAFAMVTGSVFGCVRIYFVETVGMEVWGGLVWTGYNKCLVVFLHAPVMCKKRPCSGRCFVDCTTALCPPRTTSSTSRGA